MLLKKLEKFIKKNGYAKAASLLGYSDTSALKKWISRGNIPAKQIGNVKNMLSSNK